MESGLVRARGEIPGPTPWDMPLYARLTGEVPPFGAPERFRPLDRAYDGDAGFWRLPSPEPDLDDAFWDRVKAELPGRGMAEAARNLAAGLRAWEPDGRRLVFAAILRAGVPVADWLRRLLPESAAAALSLFVGVGVDREALARLRADHPGRRVVFVDGWTGKGGVARALAELGAGPLAVLVDPWGWADFAGIREDRFCASACFTGLATLGFSRTFVTGPDEIFSAYRFPERHLRRDLVAAWRAALPAPEPFPDAGDRIPRPERFSAPTSLRIHANEVCRALVNAAPTALWFRDGENEAREEFGLLLALARARGVAVEFAHAGLACLRTRVACRLG